MAGKFNALNPIREQARAAFRPNRQWMEWAADVRCEQFEQTNQMARTLGLPALPGTVETVYRDAQQAEWQRQFEQVFSRYERGQAYPG